MKKKIEVAFNKYTDRTFTARMRVFPFIDPLKPGFPYESCNFNVLTDRKDTILICNYISLIDPTPVIMHSYITNNLRVPFRIKVLCAENGINKEWDNINISLKIYVKNDKSNRGKFILFCLMLIYAAYVLIIDTCFRYICYKSYLWE